MCVSMELVAKINKKKKKGQEKTLKGKEYDNDSIYLFFTHLLLLV